MKVAQCSIFTISFLLASSVIIFGSLSLLFLTYRQKKKRKKRKSAHLRSSLYFPSDPFSLTQQGAEFTQTGLGQKAEEAFLGSLGKKKWENIYIKIWYRLVSTFQSLVVLVGVVVRRIWCNTQHMSNFRYKLYSWNASIQMLAFPSYNWWQLLLWTICFTRLCMHLSPHLKNESSDCFMGLV